MRTLEFLRAKFVSITAAHNARWHLYEFQCGDCERLEKCGLFPDEPCIVKATRAEQHLTRPRSLLLKYPPIY